MDPYFMYDDGYDDGFEDGEEYVFDTYDQIVDENAFDDIDPDRDENNYDLDIDGTEMGLMGALAEEMAAEGNYDLDENTDRENMERARRVSNATQTRSNLRPFEQYVHDFIQRGFRHPDD